MEYRLTVSERNEIAFKLRSEIQKKTEPEVWELTHDPNAQPHDLCLGIFAFEYFVEKFRKLYEKQDFRNYIEYNIGWILSSLQRNEQKISNAIIARQTTSLIMVQVVLSKIHEIADVWESFKSLYGIKQFEYEKINLFLYEVLYEIVYEYVIEQQYSRKK